MQIATQSMILCLLWAISAAAAHAEDFRGDIDTVRQFLDRDASYSSNERAQAESEFAKLRASASDMSRAAFQLAVARIAALTRNGHTMLLPGLWPHQFNRTPLHYCLFADGLFVIHTPKAMHDLLGARVLSIDGRNVEALRQTFTQYFGGRAGKRDEWIGFLIESPALLHAAGAARFEDRVELQVELADGSRVTRTLRGVLDPPQASPFEFLQTSRLIAHASENIISAGAVPLYLADIDRAFRIAALPEYDGQFVQLRSNVSLGAEKIDAFASSASSILQRAKPRNLIVDLRFDGGGDLNTTRAFFEMLPTLTPSDGRIFALTSGRTFSAGISSLGYLKQAGGARVTIVGEPIGDELEFWAEGEVLQLPVSKAALLYATERHNYVTGCPEPDCHRPVREHPIRVTTLEPDIATPLTYADYRAGRDPALERVRTEVTRIRSSDR
jgi:hypothetical protein